MIASQRRVQSEAVVGGLQGAQSAMLWPARVLEMRSLGEVRLCRVRLPFAQAQEITLSFTAMSFPNLQLGDIKPGVELGFSLDSSKIHVMPARPKGVA
jgi:hypothetical protein